MASQDKTNTSTQPPSITVEGIYGFFILIIEMGLDWHDSHKDYWSREEQ
jgi:hypothetical protein